MKQKFFLVANRKGIQRINHREPNLFRGEIAIEMELDIPDDVFAPIHFSAGTIEVTRDSITGAMPPTIALARRGPRKLSLVDDD